MKMMDATPPQKLAAILRPWISGLVARANTGDTVESKSEGRARVKVDLLQLLHGILPPADLTPEVKRDVDFKFAVLVDLLLDLAEPQTTADTKSEEPLDMSQGLDIMMSQWMALCNPELNKTDGGDPKLREVYDLALESKSPTSEHSRRTLKERAARTLYEIMPHLNIPTPSSTLSSPDVNPS